MASLKQILSNSAVRPMAVPSIITINIFIFLLWLFPSVPLFEFLVQNFLVSWEALSGGRVWTLLTSAFSHNMFWHIFINMFVLQNFGGVLEEVIGTKRFLKFYILSGVFSSFCHAFVSAFLLGQPEIPALGASGAISAVILVFSLVFPREKILLMGILPMPAIVGAILFVGLDLWGLVAQAGGGGLPIGHGAHLGGALAGFIYYSTALRKRLQRQSSMQ